MMLTTEWFVLVIEMDCTDGGREVEAYWSVTCVGDCCDGATNCIVE